MSLLKIFSLVLLLCFTFLNAQSQLRSPRESQAASVTQRIGLTDITISYSRPAVKGREIWGKIVPYNQVWRAGANENTTISFTDPVTINTNKIDAGIYGIHMIPTEGEWTIIISKQYTGWGSYAYDEKEDIFRFKVKPEQFAFTELLEYSFTEVKNNSAKINLSWENLNIPFNIEVDVPSVVIKNFRKDLLGAAQFQWQPYNQAANYCVQNKVNLEEAMTWINKSISLNKNFTNLNTKARLIDLQGDKPEAEKIRAAALNLANEADMNNYGYQLLGSNRYNEAIEVFKLNVKKYPDSWNTYDSLAEAYMTIGENELALENYKEALSKVGDEQNRKRIENTIEQISK